MDSNGQQPPPERLEDQLRRMLLNSASSQSAPTFQQEPYYTGQTVNLPSPRHHEPPSYPHSFEHHRQNVSVPQQHQHHRGGGGYAGRQYRHAPSYRQTGSSPVHHRSIDPNTFDRRRFGPGQSHPQHQLFNPQMPRSMAGSSSAYGVDRQAQAQYLERIADKEVAALEMSQVEHDEKTAFCTRLQQICNEVQSADASRIPRVNVEFFGSFKSGFASAGSDMDLVIVAPDLESSSACFSLLEDDLPRALEKKLLQKGIGARLLTRTRVPIIKVCERPDSPLLDRLRMEREKWDILPNEKKYPHLHQENVEDDAVEDSIDTNGRHPSPEVAAKQTDNEASSKGKRHHAPSSTHKQHSAIETVAKSVNLQETPEVKAEDTEREAIKRHANEAPKWTRERRAGPLDFPREGVGILCDINFFNPLGLHNTQMLRCYSMCDPRVRPMVLFVKAWAKQRKINSSYSGTLSSYGYVLMVLHYLVNIAQPPVLPNLQIWHPFAGQAVPAQRTIIVDGWSVSFFGDEHAIIDAARSGQITTNNQSIGSLLTGFFDYFSSIGGRQNFHWMRNVLSLRTQGGLLTKEQKGWVKALTEEGEGKRVQHRYLFCIEDPFELHHNVARTVTHHGIVAIRDEFRRAHRILMDVGFGNVPSHGDLFDEVVELSQGEPAQQEIQLKPEDFVTAGSTGLRKESNTAPTKPPKAFRLGGAGAESPMPVAAETFDVANESAFPSLSASKKTQVPRKRTEKPKEESTSGMRPPRYRHKKKASAKGDIAE